MEEFIFYFFLFFLYSIIGWIFEVTYVFILDKNIINRGFLIGPYLPIYGSGAIIMILYLSKYKENFIIVFLLAMFVCSLLEYITSYVMEKLFRARWWDYSNLKFNVNGRICLKNSILFGILGLFLIYLVNPLLVNVINNMNNYWLVIVTIICLVIFLMDFIISFNVISKIKHNYEGLKLDATIELRNLVNQTIKKNYLQNRIFKAFPYVKIKRN